MMQRPIDADRTRAARVTPARPGRAVAPSLAGRKGRGDLAFRMFTSAAGIFVLVLLAAIAIFLIVKALPAFSRRHTATSGAPSSGRPDGDARLRHRGARLRHPRDRGHRPGHRLAGGHGGRAVRRRVRAAAAGQEHGLPARPARRRALRRLRPVGPGLAGAAHEGRPGLPRPPLLAGSRSSRTATPGIPTGSPFVVGVVLAIMILPIISAIIREIVVQADPAAEGSGARPGRDPVGDDPDGGAAAEPLGHHRRHDPRPRPRARRDHRGRPGAALVARSSTPTSSSRAATRSPPTSPCSSVRPAATAARP